MRLRQAIKILKGDWRGKQSWKAYDLRLVRCRSRQSKRYAAWMFADYIRNANRVTGSRVAFPEVEWSE